MKKELEIKNKIALDKHLKVARFKKDIKTTAPHKHNNYFELIILTSGSGFHRIDANRFPIEPPMAFFIRKEQVHCWELTGEPEGFVIILKKEFIDECRDIELINLTNRLSKIPKTKLVNETYINSLLELLLKEFKFNGPLSMFVMEGLLKAILAKILLHEISADRLSDIGKSLYLKFEEQLEQAQLLKNSIAYYADLFNTSPQNLNAACRKAVNLSASEVLAKYLTSEAKRLLLYTQLTVSEIAHKLEFKDNSHFVKYFKRYTGQTPGSFRAHL